MITTIIFDLGGILIPERGNEITAIIASEIGISSQTLDDALSPYKEAMTKGEITLKEAYERIKISLRTEYSSEKIVAKHIQTYNELCTARDPKIIEIIKE